MFKFLSLRAFFALTVGISAAQAQECTEQELSRRSFGLTEEQAFAGEKQEVTVYNGRRLLEVNRLIVAILGTLRAKPEHQEYVEFVESVGEGLRYPSVRAWEDPAAITKKIKMSSTILLGLINTNTATMSETLSIQGEYKSFLGRLQNPKSWIPQLCESLEREQANK